MIAEGTLLKHSLHSVRCDFNAIGTVRDVQELTIALGLRECHEPWSTQVSEDLRFAVKGLDELAYFCGDGDTRHLDAICLIHLCHHLCPYSQRKGHKDGADVFNCLGAVDFRYESIKGEKKNLP
jgi:hypothetical protein